MLTKGSLPTVFVSLGYWDHDEDKAHAECTVTFEQYLAAVFHAKIKVCSTSNSIMHRMGHELFLSRAF